MKKIGSDETRKAVCIRKNRPSMLKSCSNVIPSTLFKWITYQEIIVEHCRQIFVSLVLRMIGLQEILARLYGGFLRQRGVRFSCSVDQRRVLHTHSLTEMICNQSQLGQLLLGQYITKRRIGWLEMKIQTDL